ncbi:hypothetical protein AAFC00_005507 [Neodothiora populina]|uniref:Phosphatidylinositol-specific phospholipase C X domain-containing protein n=1 Tax=Neodothiora populina TaxID=2781224 RepID=A0ABR3PL41_9PEZI
MPPSTLTIRNLTSTPLELKTVERYGVPKIESRGFFNVTQNLTALIGNSTAPSPVQLAEHSKSFTQEDVSVRIEPFTVAQTDVNTVERSPKDILRLTFEHDGQRYRIDARSSKESVEFTPMTPDPKARYTGVWIDSESFLAIYSSSNLNCWMKEMSDATPLSGLSIPGTHNSPTHHKALPSVRCQAVSPKEQLANGVRFFDIRVQPEKPEDPTNASLILVHGVFPISLTGPKYLRKLVDDILHFLSENPSETLIMSLKREGTGSATDEQLSQILRTHYTGDDKAHWYTEPRVPSLGEARGKIVLMRRFALAEDQKREWDGRGWCLDAQNWADNTACDTHGSVCVQDFYEVLETENIDKKITLCCDHLERAGDQVCPVPGVTCDAVNPVPAGPLYLNFLSASNFWKVGCWPDKIAAKINPHVVDFLCTKHKAGQGEKGDGGVGIVICDWVGNQGDWDLVRCIVGMNARLEMIEKGQH